MTDKSVLPLAMGGLGLGVTEFTIMGLLPDIAGALRVSIPEAGHFISAYALGVVVGAPLLIGFSAGFPPKKVLISLMILFTVFNGLSALAGDYTFMLITRFLSGLPHGAFFGVGAVVASRLATPGREARYISMMFSGLTLANLLMVPLVTFIGHSFHWRWYFIIVIFIGLLTLLSIYLWLPAMDGGEKKGIKSEIQFLKSGRPWFILLITAIGFGGLFAWFSYITPLMTEVSGFAPGQIAWIMILAGGGMVLGNLMGGFLTDRLGGTKTTLALLFAMILVLTLIFFFSSYKVPSLILTFLCGGLSMSTASPLNMMMMKSAPGSEMMGAAFIQAAFNIANSAGAYLGGIPLEHGLPFNYPSLVGAGMTLAGILLCFGFLSKYKMSE